MSSNIYPEPEQQSHGGIFTVLPFFLTRDILFLVDFDLDLEVVNNSVHIEGQQKF